MNKESLVKVVTVFMTFLLLFVTFRNVQYPLLWNDEGETAMYGNQILRNGYPKVHDGKNTLFHFAGSYSANAYVEKLDAYVGNVWGQYYLAAPLLALANSFNDPYQKTLILRGGFTAIGVAGVLIFPLLFINYINGKKTRWKAYLVFLIIELTSVPLLLHLRQFRVYPLIIFLMPFLLYKIINLNHKDSRETTEFILLGMLFVLFNLSYIVYASVMLTVFINSLVGLEFIRFNSTGIWHYIKSNKLQWYGFSILSVLPIVMFHRILQNSLGLTNQFGAFQYSFFQKITIVTGFFLVSELLLPVLLLYLKVRKTKNEDTAIARVVKWLILFVIISMIIGGLTPFYYTRYFIHLQPVISIAFVLVAYGVVNTTGNNVVFWLKNNSGLMTIVMLWILLVVVPLRMFWVTDYIREMKNPVKGVLDYIVVYITNNYPRPKALTLATNYEEMSLMYYLGSKVVVGFSGVNYAQEKTITPDILIPRRSVTSVVNSLKMVDSFRGNAYYKETILPVVDYPVNNIPEMVVYPRHIFKTLTSTSEENNLRIYEKK